MALQRAMPCMLRQLLLPLPLYTVAAAAAPARERRQQRNVEAEEKIFFTVLKAVGGSSTFLPLLSTENGL
jgi:hypothetical protein